MKKILLISNSILSHDPRLINQGKAFEKKCIIDTLGIGSLPQSSHSFQIKKILQVVDFHYQYPLPLRKCFTALLLFYKFLISLKFISGQNAKYRRRYWQFIRMSSLRKIRRNHYDVIWANDIDVLPMAVYLCQPNTKLVFDAHEFFLQENNAADWVKDNYTYRLYHFKKCLPRIDRMVTVSEGLADLFQKEFSIRPVVIHNSKEHYDIPVHPVNPEVIHLVHHGMALPNRNLEGLVALSQMLDKRFVMHFFLKDNQTGMLKTLKNTAAGFANVVFHSPVETHEIVATISQFDIGIFLLNDVNPNNRHSLPNKLFECIQARLMVVYTDLPDVKSIIEKYKIGLLTSESNLEEVAKTINSLTVEQINEFRKNTEEASLELSATSDWQKMRNIVDELIS